MPPKCQKAKLAHGWQFAVLAKANSDKVCTIFKPNWGNQQGKIEIYMNIHLRIQMARNPTRNIGTFSLFWEERI